jgi:hypothetical protein
MEPSSVLFDLSHLDCCALANSKSLTAITTTLTRVAIPDCDPVIVGIAATAIGISTSNGNSTPTFLPSRDAAYNRSAYNPDATEHHTRPSQRL